MNQQCSATVKHYIKCSNCLPLVLANALSLKLPLINRLITDRLLTKCQSDIASTHRHLEKAVDRPTLVALPRVCSP